MKEHDGIHSDLSLLLVGGTGRSGTSFVYRQILMNDEITGYKEFESRQFTMESSLVDVYAAYAGTFGDEQFGTVCRKFRENTYRQFSILYENRVTGVFRRRAIDKALLAFINGLRRDRDTNQPVIVAFRQRAALLFQHLFDFRQNEIPTRTLLEKTPHNILVFPQIKKIFPQSKLLHVVRDPRAIAESLVRQTWGPKHYHDAVVWVRQILETCRALQ